jgi:uncharacterized protein (TIGR03067 family)
MITRHSAIVAASFLIAVSLATDALAMEADELRGSWKAVSADVEGKPMSMEESPVMTLADGKILGPDGKEALVAVPAPDGKEVPVAASYRTDSTKEPKEVDFIYAMEHGTVTMRAIYKIEKDQLTICMSPALAVEDQKVISKRLADFASGPGKFIVVYRRAKESDKAPDKADGGRDLLAWKKEWARSTTTSEVGIETRMCHAAEAIRLAPKDEPMLSEMWDYLGRIYKDEKDYERAEKAFKEALAVAGNDPNPSSQRLWIYNNLAWLYERTGDTERQKAALLKAAEANRIHYKGDSTQEAACLLNLAEIARAAGDKADAHALLERAIAMEAGLPQPESFSLNFMKEKLETWKKTDVIPAP